MVLNHARPTASAASDRVSASAEPSLLESWTLAWEQSSWGLEENDYTGKKILFLSVSPEETQFEKQDSEEPRSFYL